MLTSGAYGYISDYLVWWLILVSIFIHTWCFFKLFPWRQRRRLGLVVGNFFVFLCLVGVAATAFESYLRFVSVETDTNRR